MGKWKAWTGEDGVPEPRGWCSIDYHLTMRDAVRLKLSHRKYATLYALVENDRPTECQDGKKYRKGWTFISIETMAKLSGLCKRTVQRGLKDLEKSGLVKRHTRGQHQTCVWELCWHRICPTGRGHVGDRIAMPLAAKRPSRPTPPNGPTHMNRSADFFGTDSPALPGEDQFVMQPPPSHMTSLAERALWNAEQFRMKREWQLAHDAAAKKRPGAKRKTG